MSKKILHSIRKLNTSMCHDAFCIVSGYSFKNNKLFLNTRLLLLMWLESKEKRVLKFFLSISKE